MVVVGSWIKFGLFKTSSLSPDVTPVGFLVVVRNEGFGISGEIADLKSTLKGAKCMVLLPRGEARKHRESKVLLLYN
jgi:hypothetical protein